MLAEQLGYGTGDEGIAKMTKDLEKGAIASNVAIEALLKGMQKYDGMMDSMANETASGLKSQIEDTFEINVFRKWGQGLQDGAKRGLGSVVKLLDEAEDSLSKFGDLLYEIGEKASNWLADKFENAIQRITDITGSFEFKEASLGEKISMLWNGVIVDPLKEWWEGGGQQKTAETAGKVGKWMGEMLTKGLLAILGITDIFADSGIDEEGGMSIAQSFAKGFTEGFDVSAITSKIVDAIGNVWGALPTWAKVLVGGYTAGKVAGGIANFAGGIANFAGGVGSIIGSSGTIGAGGAIIGASGLLGLIGKTGVAGVGASGILGTMANAGYTLLGGTSALSVTPGMAALAGGAGIAGGITGGIAVGKGAYDLYGSYKAYKSGNKTETKAKAASGGSAIGGAGAGAGIGFAIGGPLGALIGAGIGGAAGLWGGSKWGDSIRETAAEAKFANKELAEAAVQVEKGKKSQEEFNQEFEKAKWELAKKSFGDIKLSMEEIARLANQVVWGDDLQTFEKFSSATKQAQASLQTLNAAGEQTDRWMWKAKLGVKFNEDEIESIKASFDDYIQSAKNFVENKHYEFTASAELILDLESEEGKSILEGGNAYYAKIQEQLDGLGSQLSETVEIALEDGVITLDEQAEITNLQQQIQEITSKLAKAESDAKLELIKLKFGNGNLDLDSFNAFMETIQATIDERITATEDAFTVQVANLKLQLADGAITQEEYDEKLQTLIDGYKSEVESVTVDVLGVELEIIGDAFSGKDVLGDDAVDDLNNIINKCIEEGITPAELTLDQIIDLSGNENLSQENASLIQDYLNQVFEQLDLDQFELIEVDGKLQLKLKTEPTIEGDTDGQVKETVDNETPDTVETVCGIDISGQPEFQNQISVLADDFGIPESQTAAVLMMLTGDKQLLNQIDVSQLAKEFGVPESVAKDVLNKLTGEKSIENKLSIIADEFGLPDSVEKTIAVNITAVKGAITNMVGNISNMFGGNGFRGGVFGGTGAQGSFARGGIAGKVAGNIHGFSDGGIVRGGSQLIEVAEEGSPEMVIPLSSQRRGRALKLWAQAGNIMGVPGFARGGIIGGNGSKDEGIRFTTYGDDRASGGQTVEVDIGGITVQINVTAANGENLVDAIKAQADEIAEVVAGVMVDAIGGQYVNTPLRGGVA